MKVPSAADVRLPKPVDLKITLPTGAVLKAPNDISKGSPTPASASFGLLLQLGPLLGSMECLLKILKLLKPLIDVIKGLPFPPVKAIKDFVLAAKDLIPCFGVVLPVSLIPFIKDILCVIHATLQGVHDGLKSVAGVMENISTQMAGAVESGNDELKQVLEAAQENAMISASQFTAALAPLSALLTMIEPIMGLAGLQPFKLPDMGEATDATALKSVVGALEGAINALGTVTEALGGCS